MEAGDENAIELRGACISFDSVRALDSMSFSVRKGEMFGLVGPDGAGKTTAIRALLGIHALDAGEARVLGLDPIADGPKVKSIAGYLAQRFTLYGDLTVEENLRFFAEIHQVRQVREKLEELLAFTRLGDFRGRRADQLSGGMQKKLALASTLIHTPQVLFLDEPTTGVDPIARREFWSLLSQRVLAGLSVLISTPYLDEAERCARVALVRNGHTLALDTPASLRASLGIRILEVACTPVRRARQLVEGSPRISSVQLFGDRLHVTPRDPDDELRDLFDGLEGVEVRSIRSIVPSLEDVFIARVEES